MTNNELATIFIDIIKSLFCEFLVGNFTNNFVDLLTIGERVDKRMYRGNIMDPLIEVAYPKKSIALGKKKEGEVHVVSAEMSKPMSYRHNNSNYPLPNLLG